VNGLLAPDQAFAIRHCLRCGAPYDWRRSTSRSLRMTYCGSLCEVADLGATIEAMLTLEQSVGVISTAAVAPLDIPYSVPAGASGHAQSAQTGCPCCGGDMYLDEDGSETCIGCGARVVASEAYPRH
jgi:hypothetical protein